MIIRMKQTGPALLLALTLVAAPVVEAGKLKPTMKEMRLHYKAALEATDPEQFNREIALFMAELQTAQEFNFSPERKELSLEGLERVGTLVTALPAANAGNLNRLQSELEKVDQLREEYHKKVKPGAFELLMDTVKEALGFN